MKIAKEILTGVINSLFINYNSTSNKELFLEELNVVNNDIYIEDNFGINLLFLMTYFDLFVDAAKSNDTKGVEKWYHILTIENFVESTFHIAKEPYEKKTLEELFRSKKHFTTKIDNIYKIYNGENLI